MKLSLVIPAKDPNDPKLKELLRSIDAQDFSKENLETLIITDGTSESAKAIGIRRAKGEVIGILASDNELIGTMALTWLYASANSFGASYSAWYHYNKSDNLLNRYFSLIGGNDCLSYYMGKNDHLSHAINKFKINPIGKSLGDNGFFVRRELIQKTDLDNYYHIDNANEACDTIYVHPLSFIWHKTGGNIIDFFKKRYRYGLQHAFNKNRRWHLVDFRQPKDIMRLIWFIICALTIVQPLLLSLRGWMKVKDMAWFLHPVVCLLTLFTYGLLLSHLGIRKLYQSLFAPTVAQRA